IDSFSLLYDCCLLSILLSHHSLYFPFFPTRRSSDLAEAQWPLSLLDLGEIIHVKGKHNLLWNQVVKHLQFQNEDRSLLNLLDSRDRKNTRLNSSNISISYAVFCMTKIKKKTDTKYIY